MNQTGLPRAARILRRSARDISVNGLLASSAFPRGLRWRFLRLLGMDVESSTINGAVFIGSRRITIGEGAFINYGAFIDGADQVTIGARCSLGPRVVILTGTHEIGPRTRRAGRQKAGPVAIGDGAWIGANAVIMPGCTVGTGAIVAAGAVVSRDVPADTIVAGVPARPVRHLSEDGLE